MGAGSVFSRQLGVKQTQARGAAESHLLEESRFTRTVIALLACYNLPTF